METTPIRASGCLCRAVLPKVWDKVAMFKEGSLTSQKEAISKLLHFVYKEDEPMNMTDLWSMMEDFENKRNNRIAKDAGFYTSVIPYTSPHPTPLECRHEEVLDLTWIDVLFQNHFCSCQVRIKMRLGPIKNLLQWPSM